MKKNLLLFYKCIALISFSVAIYAILTYGQTYIHSDNAVPLRLLNSIREHSNIYPRTWNGANGEIYTFDTLPIVLLVMLLVKNYVVAKVVGVAISFAISCVGLLWLSKKFFGNDSWVLLIPAYCVFLSGDNTRDMILWQGAYCPELVAFTFCFVLFFIHVLKETKTKWFMFAHCVLIFLMLTRGIRYIAEYILPVCMTVLFYELFIKNNRSIREIWNDYKYWTLQLGVPSVIGFAIYKYVCSTHNMNTGERGGIAITFSIKELGRNFVATFVEGANIFGYSADSPIIINVLICVLALAIFIVFPVLQIINYRKLNLHEKLFLVFGLSHNAILLAAIILASKAGGHYLLSTAFISIIISGNYIWNVIHINGKGVAALITAIFAVTTVVYSFDLYTETIGWQSKLENQRKAAQCLMDEGITKVYANYWLGYPYEVYSDNFLVSAAIKCNSLTFQEYDFLADDSAFQFKEGKSCVLMTAEANNTVFGGDFEESVWQRVGMPDDKITIDNAYIFDFENDKYYNTDLVAYIYNEDISDRITDGFRDGMLSPREMDFNYLGNWSNDEIALTLGGVVHGPYLPLEPGHYNVKINGSNLNVCGGAVISEQSPELIDWKFVTEEDNCKEIDMNISNKVDDIQFFLNNPTEETATFYNVTIEKID